MSKDKKKQTEAETASAETAKAQETQQTGQQDPQQEPPKAEEQKAEQAEQPSEDSPKEDEDLKNKYLRLAADFQNFRNRTEREKGDIYARATEGLMKDMLPVLDDLDRAFAAAQTAGNEGGMMAGMEAIFNKFRDALKKHGLEEIEALGKPFDTSVHNAVMTCPAEDGQESGIVADVLQKGYTLNGKELRPAMVKVTQ